MEMSYLPSKKTFAILFSAIILIGGAFWLSRIDQEKQGLGIALVDGIGSLESIKKVSEKDRDNDGLADWEEALWGTDPLNPDSDGDGVLDGEEVLSNKNPLVAGPDDFLQTLVLDNNEEGGSEDGSKENLSLSGQFGVDFFQAYASLRGTGSTREVSPEIFYQTITNNVAQVEKASNFDLGDIKTTDDSENSVRAYGNSLGKNFTEGVEGVENELVVLVDILEKKNQEEVRRMEKIVISHQKILEMNLSVTVPSEARELHLNLLNTYNLFVESLKNLSQILDDPLVGIVGLGQYSQETQNLEVVIEDLREYFNFRNIVFNESEKGYIFNK